MLFKCRGCKKRYWSKKTRNICSRLDASIIQMNSNTNEIKRLIDGVSRKIDAIKSSIPTEATISGAIEKQLKGKR